MNFSYVMWLLSSSGVNSTFFFLSFFLSFLYHFLKAAVSSSSFLSVIFHSSMWFASFLFKSCIFTVQSFQTPERKLTFLFHLQKSSVPLHICIACFKAKIKTCFVPVSQSFIYYLHKHSYHCDTWAVLSEGGYISKL